MATTRHWGDGMKDKNFIYVKGEKNKAKMIALGYKLIDTKGDFFIFKNKDEALTFSLDDIQFVETNVLTF